MIIFTVTSQRSGQVYVGSTRNDIDSQWFKMVSIASQLTPEEIVKYPLYVEISEYGPECFLVEEYDRAEVREEVYQLEEEALQILNAKSLKGYKVNAIPNLKAKKSKRNSPNKQVLDHRLVSLFLNFEDDINFSESDLDFCETDIDFCESELVKAEESRYKKKIEEKEKKNTLNTHSAVISKADSDDSIFVDSHFDNEVETNQSTGNIECNRQLTKNKTKKTVEHDALLSVNKPAIGHATSCTKIKKARSSESFEIDANHSAVKISSMVQNVSLDHGVGNTKSYGLESDEKTLPTTKDVVSMAPYSGNYNVQEAILRNRRKLMNSSNREMDKFSQNIKILLDKLNQSL